ncbi:hypothetical protein AB205_0147960, partial [Aquarana catesbeiana]
MVSRLSTQQINNISYIDKFVLLGLVSAPTLEKVLFVVFSVIYTMTIFGNLTVILIIHLDSDLHKPMYFFLANLAFLETFYTTATTPNTLKNLLQKNRTISFVGCFTQMFFFIGLGSAVCVLLSVMAYDRYVAICQPLITVLRIPTVNGREKVFSTCGSHLIVVTLFFGTAIITYMLPGSSSFNDHKRLLSVVYGVLTPLINPLIYSFRNTDFQHATTKRIQFR